MLGINSGDDFPQGNTNPADDRKFLLTREWSVDGGHIEADSNVNTTLKGPLWDPSRGYPHAVKLKVDGELLATHFGRDADGRFRLKERTDKDFQLYIREVYNKQARHFKAYGAPAFKAGPSLPKALQR